MNFENGQQSWILMDVLNMVVKRKLFFLHSRCRLNAESNTKRNCSGSDNVKNLTFLVAAFSCLTENGRIDISLRIVSLETKLCSL